MSNIEISSSVARADGTLLYQQDHLIQDATQVQVDWLNGALAKAFDHAQKLATAPKEDNDSYTTTMKVTGYPDVVFQNVSYNAVVKQAKYWQDNITGEILKVGEKEAKQKEKDARR